VLVKTEPYFKIHYHLPQKSHNGIAM